MRASRPSLRRAACGFLNAHDHGASPLLHRSSGLCQTPLHGRAWCPPRATVHHRRETLPALHHTLHPRCTLKANEWAGHTEAACPCGMLRMRHIYCNACMDGHAASACTRTISASSVACMHAAGCSGMGSVSQRRRQDARTRLCQASVFTHVSRRARAELPQRHQRARIPCLCPAPGRHLPHAHGVALL